jgi:creatinine amidohydrolase/Fe(II)-dependent formamide hydrolase-like protein
MTSQRQFALSELTYEEAGILLRRGAVALLPTGATEAHGPHLPLSTDVIISAEGARRAARMLEAEGKTALVLPPIAYAVTEFAADFTGTARSSAWTKCAIHRRTRRCSVWIAAGSLAG